MDTFLSQKYCDRCGGSLEGGRIMSMFNTQCICMSCKKAETKRADYKKAQDAVHAQELAGNRNFSASVYRRKLCMNATKSLEETYKNGNFFKTNRKTP